jgi:hypothetical protein
MRRDIVDKGGRVRNKINRRSIAVDEEIAKGKRSSAKRENKK